MVKYLSTQVPHLAQSTFATRSRRPPIVSAVWSSTRTLPPHAGHGMSRAVGSTREAVDTSMGRSADPPGSSRERVILASRSFFSVRSASRRNVLERLGFLVTFGLRAAR